MDQVLYILKVRERGDDEQYQSRLYTLDPAKADECARSYNQDYPQRKRWEPYVLIDEVTLDRELI